MLFYWKLYQFFNKHIFVLVLSIRYYTQKIIKTQQEQFYNHKNQMQLNQADYKYL